MKESRDAICHYLTLKTSVRVMTSAIHLSSTGTFISRPIITMTHNNKCFPKIAVLLPI